MIKYLLTSDAIFIQPLKLQISRETDYFDEILSICKDESSQIDDLSFLSGNLSYSSSHLSIEDNDEFAEIYFDGKYYSFPYDFYKTCKQLLKDRTSLTLEGIHNFLLNCFRNSDYHFEELWNFLSRIKFNFMNNGNILVLKKYKENDENLKNRFMEEYPIKLLSYKKYDEENYCTIIEINPKNINNEIVAESTIRDIIFPSYVRNTFIESHLFSTLYNVIEKSIKSHETDEQVYTKLESMLGRNIKNLIYDGKLEFLTTSEDKNPLIDFLIRLCQE